MSPHLVSLVRVYMADGWGWEDLCVALSVTDKPTQAAVRRLVIGASYVRARSNSAETKIAAEREAMEREVAVLRQVIQHAEIVRENVKIALQDIKPRNGAEADTIRRHREILGRPFMRVAS
jgi:hypothetical protein